MNKRQPIEHNGWRLVRKDGSSVKVGDTCKGHVIADGRPPHKPASSGFVVTNHGAEFYAFVAGCAWIHPDLRPNIVI